MDDEQVKAQKLIRYLVESTERFIMTGNAKDGSWKTEGFKFDEDTDEK